jgi:hypothetical protein
MKIAFKVFETPVINREFIVKAFTFFKSWGLPMTLTDEQMTCLGPGTRIPFNAWMTAK